MHLFPSEVARLVLGYLKDMKCIKTYRSFLEESPNLDECKTLMKKGFHPDGKIHGQNLLHILELYDPSADCNVSRANTSPTSVDRGSSRSQIRKGTPRKSNTQPALEVSSNKFILDTSNQSDELEAIVRQLIEKDEYHNIIANTVNQRVCLDEEGGNSSHAECPVSKESRVSFVLGDGKYDTSGIDPDDVLQALLQPIEFHHNADGKVKVEDNLCRSADVMTSDHDLWEPGIEEANNEAESSEHVNKNISHSSIPKSGFSDLRTPKKCAPMKSSPKLVDTYSLSNTTKSLPSTGVEINNSQNPPSAGKESRMKRKRTRLSRRKSGYTQDNHINRWYIMPVVTGNLAPYEDDESTEQHSCVIKDIPSSLFSGSELLRTVYQLFSVPSIKE